jgi:hypothetical protein
MSSNKMELLLSLHSGNSVAPEKDIIQNYRE